ncbi:MAG: hypothetical protein EOO70_07400 [Myxococcaceae bacterium]|nr:MAG: hypothetical protein EOO70_07400 [Myxococcaceae bacterium]
MQFTFDLDIQGIVAKATAPEALRPILEKAITKALSDAVDSATGYNSEFRKQLTSQLADAMPHGIGIDDVSKFQHLLNAAISSAVHGANSETIAAAMNKVAGAAMPDVPARVKLSEVIKIARDSFHKNEGEGFYAFFDPSERGGGGHLYLDQDESPGRAHGSREGRKYDAIHRLAFTDDGVVYALRFDSKDVTVNSRPQVITHLEGLMLSMYTGRTTIEVDIDDDRVQYMSSDYFEG